MSKVLETIERGGYRIVIRRPTKADVPGIGEMSYGKVFPEILEGESLEQETDRWKGRFETCPEGLIVAEDAGTGRIVGAGSVQLIDWKYGNELPVWVELTDNGTIRHSHNPDGNTRHIVSHHVDMEYVRLGLGVGSALLKQQIASLEKSPQEYLIVGHTLGRGSSEEFGKYKRALGDITGLGKEELERRIWAYATSMRMNEKTGVSEPVDSLTRFFYRGGMRPVRVLVGFENYPDYNHCIIQAYAKGGGINRYQG